MYCPNCGSPTFDSFCEKSWQCSGCGFHFYFNVAATVGLIIEAEGEILFCVRGREPNKGKLDFPGGFMERHETAEQSVRREVREELGIEVGDIRYLCTGYNDYLYKNVTYPLMDIYHYCRLEKKPTVIPADDVADIVWVTKEQIPWTEFSCESVRVAVDAYLKLNG